jgi:hypothetical protein
MAKHTEIQAEIRTEIPTERQTEKSSLYSPRILTIMRKGILIDTSRGQAKIISEVEYDDSKRIDGMFYRVAGQQYPIPIAYLYPLENRDKVQALLDELNAAAKIYEDVSSRIYYQDLMKLR